MNVFISGTHSGIGRAIAELFLSRGAHVVGFDIRESTIDHAEYEHHVIDVADKLTLPEVPVAANIVVSNAGVQNSGKDIEVNLMGAMNFVEKYAIQPEIKSVLFVASSSAHTGDEFPEYAVSKGGLLNYVKNVGRRIAKYGATCNSISPGGVKTELNKPVMDDPALWNRIMDVTPLKRWAEPEDIAEWVWFLTVVNKNCTGQDILVDNGEKDLNSTFVWP